MSSPRGRAASLIFAALCLACGEQQAEVATAVPHPSELLGFTPGDDYRIADFGQLKSYFEALAEASTRVSLSIAGESWGGREMLVAVISSEENLSRVEEYRTIARTLAQARRPSEEEARELARRGRAIVWIDSGLHASETAHAQHTMLLAHRLATEETDEARRIRDNVILVLAPVVNPDGLDLVADWYRKTVDTPHRDSPMPWIFNRYSHWENNRDYFMQNDVEAQIVSRLLYVDWLPQVMYNHHQGFYPSRIFVPPFPDPYNPNIDPGVIRGIELFGAAMQHRFELEGKDGVLSRYGFSAWYNGSLRTTTYFHNMIGILSETTHDSPSPFVYDPAEMPETFGNGWSTSQPSVNYPRPWRGGELRFSDAIDYMMTGSMAVLDAAARYREELLYGVYQMGRRQITLGETESPRAYVIPAGQHDPPVADKVVEVLMRGGIEVHRASQGFEAAGRSFARGAYVIPLAQPYRPFVKDLLEPQRYPDIRRYPDGPPVPPYDNAGWTLSYQMGVEAVALDSVPYAGLIPLDAFPAPRGGAPDPSLNGYAIHPNTNQAFTAVNALLAEGVSVSRLVDATAAATTGVPLGSFIVVDSNQRERLTGLSAELGIDLSALEGPLPGIVSVSAPRIGLYQSWVVEWVDGFTSSEGWARFVLDGHGFEYTRLTNVDIQAGDLSSSFDVIVIPSQDLDDILYGYRPGRPNFGLVHQNLPPPEYQGGIEDAGVEALRDFMIAGGTLVLVDKAADLGTETFRLPMRDVLATLPEETFFAPGSVVRIDVDRAQPLAFGMPERAAAYFRKGRAYVPTSRRVRVAARYAGPEPLLSGWINGGRLMSGWGAAVEMDVGAGRAVLFGFSPYFRGQPHGTYKLFFNALF